MELKLLLHMVVFRSSPEYLYKIREMREFGFESRLAKKLNSDYDRASVQTLWLHGSSFYFTRILQINSQ